MISIHNAGKKFNRFTIFDDLSASFKKGKYYTITGKNGSGKSTLMSCLLLQSKLDKGYITLDGNMIPGCETKYIEQVFGINDLIGWIPGMTVGQHLDILYKNSFSLRDSIKIDLLSPEEALDQFEISHVFDREPNTLSSGQEQRVRLASLLLRPALYYFLDEPEKRLDDSGTNLVAKWIEKRTQEGAMVCVATHSPLLKKIAGANNLNIERLIS